MTRTLLALLLGSAAALASTAPALAADASAGSGKSAGDLMVRGRAIAVVPEEKSSIKPIGGHADVDNDVVPELDFSYFLTDHIAMELILATTQHRVKAKGTSVGDVDLGTVRLLPPTLTAQYHFLPKGEISPYVGAGVNYTFFYDVNAPSGTSVSYTDGFGAALQAGVDFHISGNWYANVDVKQLFLNTTVKVNGGAVKSDTDLNPTIFGIGIGYKFSL